MAPSPICEKAASSSPTMAVSNVQARSRNSRLRSEASRLISPRTCSYQPSTRLASMSWTGNPSRRVAHARRMKPRQATLAPRAACGGAARPVCGERPPTRGSHPLPRSRRGRSPGNHHLVARARCRLHFQKATSRGASSTGLIRWPSHSVPPSGWSAALSPQGWTARHPTAKKKAIGRNPGTADP